jgi:hypothetical protein
VGVRWLMLRVSRYYESQAWLLQGRFPASRGSVFLLTFVACAVSSADPTRPFGDTADCEKLIVTSLVIVLVVSPTKHEL